MLTLSAAKLLIDYKSWADELTLASVAKLPPGEAHRQRPTLFKSIIGTLNHSLIVDLIWRAHLEGREHGFSSRREILHDDVAALASAQRSCNEWLQGWCSSQTDASLGQLARFKFISGEAGQMTRGAIVFHIVNHATYHRGWVSDLFFQVPAKPPTTDTCAYPGVLARGD
ncbi:MAG TPA: DinB family protein [Steroidobacteraceae bacterium]